MSASVPNGFTPRVQRWEKAIPPSEGELRRLLSAEGLAPYAWGNPPGDSYIAHRHSYHKVLFCVEGSIRLDLVDAREVVELRPGDRLGLPAGLLHAATVGPHGVICLEAHRLR